MDEKLLSVVIPAYNEEENIIPAAETILAILDEANIPCELIFVNDGSRDKTWERIEALAQKQTNVHGICLSKNFGKEAAIFAGLSAANGAASVVLDADMQHPPEQIVTMYRMWEQGAEIVQGVKKDRGEEAKLHSLAAKTFYALISRATKTDMHRASDFKLLDKKAVLALLSLPERNAFFRALSSWIGFSTAEVEYEVRPRTKGETKWSYGALFRYAVRSLASFSSMPLKIILFLGALVLLVSVVLSGIALYQKAVGIALGGFTTVILVLLFMGSMIMLALGCIGYYIAKIYDEIKARPRYIISKKC